MGSLTDRPPRVIVAEAQSDKDQSRTNPDGVTYLDHVWELIRNIEQPLRVVLRVDNEVFDAVPIKAFWHRYRYDFDPPERLHYELMFDLPDQVVRHIQSNLAAKVLLRHFGFVGGLLPSAIRGGNAYDPSRKPYWNADETTIISDDWLQLKEAIRLTAQDANGQIVGQCAYVWSGRHQLVYVRVNLEANRLELKLSTGVLQQIEQDWVLSLRQDLTP